ncbi:hypothetical protein HDU98_008654 [Podochytrium sp. JEL0797]|nr:hypothetical protein HDU98_008654 [Podochytrium sp. JEL0797]
MPANSKLTAFLKRLNPKLSNRDWINWFKAVLALFLGYVYMFTPALMSWMQPRDTYWLVFVQIVHSPAQTVGSHLYITSLAAVIITISAAMWAFLQGVCGSQHYLMGIGLFPYIYMLSLMRAQSHDRYFQVTIFGILISYIATAGETGVLGPNTSWGNQLDYNYLAHTIISYFMGLGEISYSHFSTKDYATIVQQTKSVAAVLFSEHTILNGPETPNLLQFPAFQKSITDEMKMAWHEFDDACRMVFGGLCSDLRQPAHEVKAGNDAVVEALTRAANAALGTIQTRQPAIFSDVFEHSVSNGQLLDSLTPGSKNAWEVFLQLNFHSLATTEFVQELKSLHNETHSRAQENRRVRFHFGWLIQLKALFGRIHARIAGWKLSRSSLRKASVVCKDFLLSDSSIYAFKSATAIMLFQLTLLISTNTYDAWYFERGLAPIAVAMGPSLGQTYSTLVPRIVGTVFGGTLGYVCVLVFGKETPWHILTGLLQAVPVFYVNLFYPQHATLARLCLISYTMYIFISVAYLGDPTFPDPAEYLFRLVTVISVSLVFATLFTTLFYPMRARTQLRDRISDIFRDLNIFYRKIVSRRAQTVELDARMSKIEEAETKDFRNEIFSQLVALETLVHYSTLEPRLERRFPETNYRAVISQQYELLDRLECLRLCVGENSSDPYIKRVLRFGEYGEARAEMHSTIRVLLFIFASTMVTKAPLLPNLPKASHSRSKMIDGFLTMLLEHSQPHEFDGTDPLDAVMPVDRGGMLDTLNTDKWVRIQGMSVSLREVSRVLDETVPYLKSLFGEAPDILDPEDDTLLPIFIK